MDLADEGAAKAVEERERVARSRLSESFMVAVLAVYLCCDGFADESS
jgi:hypothetical protein